MQFSVGDVVFPYGSFADNSGRVTAVWPAIGMVDVEFPNGNRRHPVEELQRVDADGNVDPPRTNSVPGGHTVYVSGGPMSQQKQALYWAGPDRRYRMTKTEQDCGKLDCPKCGSDYPLKKAVYKRRDGSSERLMGCPNCMFLIKTSDIINFQTEKEDVTVKIEVKV
jgi:hypothetical protein